MHVKAAAAMQLPFFMEEGAMDRDHIERTVEDLPICILLAPVFLVTQPIFPGWDISLGIPCTISFAFVFPFGERQ